jgi:predicted GNAT family N-acyltransferase
MAVLDALVALAAVRGLESLVLHAQTQALGFYERCGFLAEGGEFVEANIPHFKMRRVLANPRA